MNMERVYRVFLIPILIVSVIYLSGCGYTAGSLLPGNLKSIYVDDFKNKIDISSEPSGEKGFRIYSPGVEADITQGIIDQFIFDGNLIIRNKEDANLILTGKVIDYYKEPLRYDRFDNVEEYRIIITVDMELYNTVEDKVFWEQTGFIGYDTYRLTGAFTTDEAEARDGAMNDLARKVVEKVVGAW